MPEERHITGKRAVIAVEVDGVLIDSSGHPIKHMIETVKTLSTVYEILFMSTKRTYKHGEEMVKWMENQGFDSGFLFMRPIGDERKDFEIKHEGIVNSIPGGFTNLDFVIESTTFMADYWRNQNVLCLLTNIEKVMTNKKHIIIDIDGTVAKVGDRLIHLKNKDYDTFYERCNEDEPITAIIDLLHNIKDKYNFVFLTGRPERVREKTAKWLQKHNLYGHLLMRKNNDYRKDVIVKPELLLDLNNIETLDIAFILEDRQSMADQWRAMGYHCLQVVDGKF